MELVFGYALGFLVLMPLLTLMHELGHAIPQLCMKKKVVIDLGGSSPIPIIKVSRLFIRIVPFSTFHGFCSISSRLLRVGLVVTLLGGPLVTLLLAMLLNELRMVDAGQWFTFLASFGFYFTVFQLVFTLAPIKYPSFFGGYSGTKSDGLRILEALRCNESTP
ncbi:hypothetical protein ACNKV7_002137 [Vibrio cholerae]